MQLMIRSRSRRCGEGWRQWVQVIFYFLRKLADIRCGENLYSKAKPSEGSVKLAIKCIVGLSKDEPGNDDKKLKKPKRLQSESASANKKSLPIVNETSATAATSATTMTSATTATNSNSTG